MASSLCLVLAVIKQECQFFAKPFLFAFSFKDGRRKPYLLVKGFGGAIMGYMVSRYVKCPTMRVNGLKCPRFYGVAFQSAEYGMVYPSVRYLVDLGLIRFGDRFHKKTIKMTAKSFKEFAYLYARDLDAYSPYMGRRFLYKMKPLIESGDSKEVSWR